MATPCLIGCLVLAVTQPTSWTLQSEDTRLELAIIDGRPAIVKLTDSTGQGAWVDRPDAIALDSKVWLDGQEAAASWQFIAAERLPDRLILKFEDSARGLLLSSIWRARPGPGPIEHWLAIENHSRGRITVGHLDSLVLDTLHLDGDMDLWWIRRGGSNATQEGGTFRSPVRAGLDLHLVSNCDDGASPVPWMAVQGAGGRGLYVGWEFSGLGQIHASSGPQPGRLKIAVGNLPDFKTDIDPGQSLVIPAAFVGCYRGDLDEGSSRLHRFVLEKLRPPVPSGVPDPVLAYNLYLDAGGSLSRQADVLRSAAVCRDLGFEVFVPDAMWFPGTGDWRWDPQRFPQGVAPIEAYVHREGMKLGLWCAWTNGGLSEDPGALSVRGPLAHPQWFDADFAPDWKPGPFYGGRICLGCEEAKQWAMAKTRWLVDHHKLDYLKHDCGPIVMRCNKSSHRHHFGVDASYWATCGYYEVQDQLLKTFPGLLLENCSGGGHIKDFGVVQRSHYTVTTDTLSNLPDRQSLYDSTYALPPLVLQAYTYDRIYKVPGDDPGTFLWRSAMMGAWQIDPTNTATWTEEDKASIRRSVDVYRQWIRPMLPDVKVHHVLPRPDGVHWDGMFYFSPKRSRGMLYIFRPNSPDDQLAVRLKGLASDRRYWVWCEDGSLVPGLHRGSDLVEHGLPIRLPHRYSSDLVYLQDASLGKPSGFDVPGEFSLNAPRVNASPFSVSAVLAWQPSPHAVCYRVTITEAADSANPLLERVVYRTSTAIEDLTPGKTYAWTVRAVAWGGQRPQSGEPGRLVVPSLPSLGGVLLASDMPWSKATAGAGNPVRRNVNYYGHKLAIAGRSYPRGLWTHSFADATPADIVFEIAGKSLAEFRADVGLDDASGGGSVQFQILADGKLVAQSPRLRPGGVFQLKADVRDARTVTLRVLNAGDGFVCDHAVWGLPRFVKLGRTDPLE